ncbi:hypothetical protein JCM10296v2_004810 [Rhodotorula toruloides]
MATPQQHLQPARPLLLADSTALTRSSDGDEATSSARREGSSESLSPRPSFLSLPNEIIAQVYWHVTDEARAHDAAVNKRIFEIAYPFVVRTIYIYLPNCSRKLAWLAAHHKESTYVRSIGARFLTVLPDLQCAVLSKISNLTFLSIEFGDTNGVSPLPNCFFDALRALRNLVSLYIKHDERNAPLEGFSFERDVPSLRELDICAKGTLSACAPGLANIKQLSIWSPTRVESAIPWQTLSDLRAFMGAPDFPQLMASLAASAQASVIPLQSFALSAHLLQSPDQRGTTLLTESLIALRAIHLTDLCIYDLTELTRLRDSNVTLSRDQQSLRAIVEVFPALQALHLEDIRLYRTSDWHGRRKPFDLTDKPKDAILQSAEQATLASSFPAVATLLSFLQQTLVLDFHLHVSIHKGIRWRRFSRHDDFEAEGWTVI